MLLAPFILFKSIPVYHTSTSIFKAFFRKNVRMSLNHLFRHVIHYILGIKQPFFFPDFRVNDNLIQNIAEFFANALIIVVINGIESFINLFHKETAQCLVSLRLIPRTAVLTAQSVHNLRQWRYVKGHFRLFLCGRRRRRQDEARQMIRFTVPVQFIEFYFFNLFVRQADMVHQQSFIFIAVPLCQKELNVRGRVFVIDLCNDYGHVRYGLQSRNVETVRHQKAVHRVEADFRIQAFEKAHARQDFHINIFPPAAFFQKRYGPLGHCRTARYGIHDISFLYCCENIVDNMSIHVFKCCAVFIKSIKGFIENALLIQVCRRRMNGSPQEKASRPFHYNDGCHRNQARISRSEADDL